MWNVNKKMGKASALLLAAVVAAGAAGVNVYAANANTAADTDVKGKITEEVKNVWQPAGDIEGANAEIVYVITGTDGEVEKVIINDGEELLEEAENTENKLPLSMEVTYFLDGKEIAE